MVKYHGVAVEATPRSLLPSFLPSSLSLPLSSIRNKKKEKDRELAERDSSSPIF